MSQEADFSADPSSVAVDPAPKNKRKKAEEIPEGYEKVRTRIRPVKDDEGNGHHGKETQPSLGRGTPFDTSAALEQAMIEVIRVGPGKGSGWQGQLFNGQAVTYARCGQLPNSRDLFDKAAQLFGGGEYEFQGKDEAGKAVSTRKTFPGAPLPISDADIPVTSSFDDLQWQAQGLQSHGVAGTLDEEGFWQGSTQDQGDTGWIYVAARNNWKWVGPGRPLGPPPSQPGGNGTFYDPGMYDHREKKEDSEVKEMLKALLASKTAPNPMEGFLAIMQAQAEERRTQLAEDRLRWEQEKEEREARRKEESALARDSAKIQAEAQREVAKMQAEAMKGNASSAVEAAKEMAKMQQAQTTQLVTILTQKQEQGGFDAMFDRVAKFNDLVQGNKPESNPASEISETLKMVLPSVAESIKDSIYAWKGMAPPQGNMGTEPPLLTDGGNSQNSQATQTQQQQQQASLGEAGQFLQLVGYLANSARKNMPPKASVLAHGCLAYNLDERYGEVRAKIIQANPELVVMMIDQTVRQNGSPPQFVEFASMVRQTMFAPQGRAWFKALQESLASDVTREQAQAQQQKQAVATAPTAPSP